MVGASDWLLAAKSRRSALHFSLWEVYGHLLQVACNTQRASFVCCATGAEGWELAGHRADGRQFRFDCSTLAAPTKHSPTADRRTRKTSGSCGDHERSDGRQPNVLLFNLQCCLEVALAFRDSRLGLEFPARKWAVGSESDRRRRPLFACCLFFRLQTIVRE